MWFCKILFVRKAIFIFECLNASTYYPIFYLSKPFTSSCKHVFSPLQGTEAYRQLSSSSTRNNYARPQIIIKCGSYNISNLNFVVWKIAIPTNISSICKYRLSAFITSNDIIRITITYNTLFLHRWTTNTSAIPGHF